MRFGFDGLGGGLSPSARSSMRGGMFGDFDDEEYGLRRLHDDHMESTSDTFESRGSYWQWASLTGVLQIALGSVGDDRK